MEEQESIWKKIKKTKQREAVFRILEEMKKPMSAADIYQEIMRRDAACGYAVSTVYRALQIFEEEGFVDKTSLPDSDMALYEWNEGGHMHYAICLNCHKRIALKECPFPHMNLPETADGFQITGHKVEVYGYCSACSKPDDNAPAGKR